MHDTLILLGLVVGGCILIWLGDWNIKKDEKEGKKAFTASYRMKMYIGVIAIFFAALYLLRDLINLF